MANAIERIIDIRECTNGRVIKALIPNSNPDDPSLLEEFLWIRGRTHLRIEGNGLTSDLTVEGHTSGKRFEIPLEDISKGRFGDMEFEGVYRPRRVGLIDPNRRREELSLDVEKLIEITDKLTPVELKPVTDLLYGRS